MARCVGLHRLLQVDEENAMGAVVFCLLCDDTFQMSAAAMADHYIVAVHHRSKWPPEDMVFLIRADLLEG